MDAKWKAFFNTAMEKTALVGSAIYGGLSLWSLKDRNQQLQNIAKIDPVQRDRDARLQLKPSSAYQFEGGKRSGTPGLVNPHRM